MIPLGGPRQRATLAILLLNANRVVSVERLADDLYSGETPVTAVTQVQRQISELRKAFGPASAIETRAPGYLIRVAPDQLDLHRFERLTYDATQALARGDAERAAALLRDSLALWRGPPLADFAYESFARSAIARLEEIRLVAVEERLAADLALGRHAQLVGELEALVAEHPLRERFREHLMLALYRSGRQLEALEVYRSVRAQLVEELGIEPPRRLRELERAILTQDPSLDLEREPATPTRRAPGSEADRAVLVVVSRQEQLDELLVIAELLARLPGRELIVARLVPTERDLERAAADLRTRRAGLGPRARTAAFVTHDPAADVVRLTNTNDVEFVLVEAPSRFDAEQLPAELAEVLERSPADVVIRAGPAELTSGGGIVVPFGGGEHDWAALEHGACLSLATSEPLKLVGTKADRGGDRRDASRLLADASLAVQRVVGVEAEPLLAEASEPGLLAAVEPAAAVVVGLSERWRRQGIGESRRALVRGARAPILLVHRGPRPGGLAPREARTRFTWTVDRGYLQAVSTAVT